MMPFWPKESSQHFNKLKNTINFIITKIVICNYCTIEMVSTMISCENNVLQNHDPPPRLVMKKLVKLCACMIAVFVEGCTLVKEKC